MWLPDLRSHHLKYLWQFYLFINKYCLSACRRSAARPPLSCKCSRTPLDPHPLCPRCLRRQGIEECTPESSCKYCEGLPFAAWVDIIASRKRRHHTMTTPKKSQKPPPSPPLIQDTPPEVGVDITIEGCSQIPHDNSEERGVGPTPPSSPQVSMTQAIAVSVSYTHLTLPTKA